MVLYLWTPFCTGAKILFTATVDGVEIAGAVDELHRRCTV